MNRSIFILSAIVFGLSQLAFSQQQNPDAPPCSSELECVTLGSEAFGRKDWSTAEQMYSIACDQNSPTACAELGSTYYSQTGLEPSARQSFKKSCDLDAGERSAKGCFIFGLMATDGEGGAVDYNSAASAFLQACDNGPSSIAAACQMVGVFYNTGTGFPKDQTLALEYFDKACDASVAEACATAVQVRMTSIKEFNDTEK